MIRTMPIYCALRGLDMSFLPILKLILKELPKLPFFTLTHDLICSVHVERIRSVTQFVTCHDVVVVFQNEEKFISRHDRCNRHFYRARHSSFGRRIRNRSETLGGQTNRLLCQFLHHGRHCSRCCRSWRLATSGHARFGLFSQGMLELTYSKVKKKKTILGLHTRINSQLTLLSFALQLYRSTSYRAYERSKRLTLHGSQKTED